MELVSAYLIYDGRSNSYVDNGTYITVNCEQLQAFAPVPVWLQRWLPAGDGTDIIYQPSFNISSQEQLQYGNNMIQGYWIQQDGAGMMIDIATASTLINACDQCCDASPAVQLARFYTNGIPAFAAPTEAIYCITRVDDGSASAHNQFALDYTSQFHGSAKVRSSLSGTTTYQVTTFTGWPPIAVGTDIVNAGACP